MSARPVVPLAEAKPLRGRAPLPRTWLLGLALVGALLVGIFATVIYYSRLGSEGSTSLDNLDVTAGVEATSTEVNSFSGPASPQTVVPANTPVEAKKQASSNKQSERASAESDKKPRARLVSVIRENKRSDDEESDEDQRAARKEARRERRQAERGKQNRSSDELLRIRDIFEGSPRP